MKQFYFFLLALMSFGLCLAQTTIAAYSGTATPTANAVSNATATPLSRGPGITASGGTDFRSQDWTTSNSVDTSDYIEWTISAAPEYIINVESITINYDRDIGINFFGLATGPRSLVLRSSVNNFSNNIFEDLNIDTTPTTQTILISQSTTVGGNITFRVYGFRSQAGFFGLLNNGTLDIEGGLGTVLSVENTGIRINGSVVYDGLLYSGGSWSPNAPNGGTGALNALVLDGTYTENGNVAVNNLRVNSGASVSIAKTGALEVNGNLITSNNFNLESDSDEYASLIVEGSVTGTASYNRHINDFQSTPGATTGQNDLISPPLTNASQTFADFKAINTNIPSGTIGGVPSWLFGPFNNNTNAYINWTAANDGEFLISGVGYRTASSVAAPGDTFVFSGQVQTANVSVPISVGAASEWNLIGNPFPSYISADEFLALASNNALLTDDAVAIYGYDGSATNGWTVINLNSSSGYNMAPGQGFLVAAKSSGNITFTTAMRRNNGDDDFIVGRNTHNPTLKLLMSSGNNSYHTDFYFNDNSTRGLDRGYDAGIFNSSLPNFYIYSHLVEQHQGRKMAIQSLGLSDLNDVVIPLGLKVSQGQQVAFSIMERSLPGNVQVYLEDQLTDTITLLNNNYYTFNANANIDGAGRFFLRFTDSTLNIGNEVANRLHIYHQSTEQVIVIAGQLSATTKAYLYDLQGRAVISNTLNTAQLEQRLDVSSLSSGVYVLSFNNGNTRISKKLIIK